MWFRCIWALTSLAYLASACSDDGSVCAAEKGIDQAAVMTNSDSESRVVVQEGVNDPDFIMHMQMKVAIDPLSAVHHKEEHKQPQSDAAKTQQASQSDAERKSGLQNPLQGPGSALQAVILDKGMSQTWKGHAAFIAIQTAAESLPFLQMATVMGIIIVCLLIRKLIGIAGGTLMKDYRPVRVEAQFDASAKLHNLLQTLRFEPPGEEKDELQEMHPVVSENDSGNITEEEPEAEAAVESAVVAIAKRAQNLKAACQHNDPKEIIHAASAEKPAKLPIGENCEAILY